MSPGCTTQEVEARKQMVLATHPLHCKRDECPTPTKIPIDQALCMCLEERDDLRARLAMVEADIKALRDCSPEVA